jgi:hypothetical protein
MSFSFLKKRGLRMSFGVFLLVIACFFLVPGTGAAERGYSYDVIAFDIRINADSTVDISERQTYHFIGEYHQGWRNISKKGVDAITDVSVVDGDTGQPFALTSSRLEKTSPSSWGKYATFVEDGEQIIEWYYDARDETRTFVLNYTVHGAVGFYGDHDEFYWNLLTEYSVPIGRAEAIVALPEEVDPAMLHASVYADPTSITGSWERENGNSFRFLFEDIPSYGKATIAPGWPKGVVSERSYWGGFLSRIWGYVASLFVVFLTVIALVSRWYLVERRGVGRGTIVPEYDPPKNLRPAMAEVIVTERLTDKAWVATIIDLAVRGWIEIREVKPNAWQVAAIKGVTTAGVVFVTGIPVLFACQFFLGTWIPAIPITLLLAYVFFNQSRPGDFIPHDYVLSRKVPAPTEALEEYEKKFLSVLLPGTKEFSTKEMRSSPQAGLFLHQALHQLRSEVFEETEGDTRGYEVGFGVWKYTLPALLVAGLVVVLIEFTLLRSQFLFFVLALAFSLITGYLYFYFNPRLNRQGQILREEWLGFKLYLETAERYRMQNLTPETFEKYLPYAIIFGVEKKWGKAFEGISVENPSWYSGPSSGIGSSPTSSGFSAAAFSSSFASSFSSAFASSGGSSGSSGGGGSAGGGGGGGGGGAS